MKYHVLLLKKNLAIFFSLTAIVGVINALHSSGSLKSQRRRLILKCVQYLYML